MTIKLHYFIIATVLISSPVVEAQSGAVLENARASVVQVHSSCGGDSRYATGFVWPDSHSIVTALHAVGGCNKVIVHFEKQGADRLTTITKIDKPTDLAMLRFTDDVSNALPLKINVSAPAVNTHLAALGFPLNVHTMESTSVVVRFGGKVLSDLLPMTVRAELDILKSPDPAIEITNLEANLVPGHSGAPVLDSAGQVVAIADGGLENGTVGMSWAIPASYLDQLNKSTYSTTVGSANAHLFAFEQDFHPANTVTCGSAVFAKIRSLGYDEIMHSTDDVLGLAQLTAVSPVSTSLFRYDVYQDSKSGAAFVIPAGQSITQSGSTCIAPIDSHISMRISAGTYTTALEAQTLSLQLEGALVPYPQWQPDPAWTYPTARTLPDGLTTVRRKALVKFDPNPYNPFLPALTAEKAFETFAAKNGVLLQVITVDNDWSPTTLQRQQFCAFNPAAPDCSAVLKQFGDWIQTVIASHLSTFPLG